MRATSSIRTFIINLAIITMVAITGLLAVNQFFVWQKPHRTQSAIPSPYSSNQLRIENKTFQLCQFYGPVPQSRANTGSSAVINAANVENQSASPIEYTPANPQPICAVDSLNSSQCGCSTGHCTHAQRPGSSGGLTWRDMRPMPFQLYGQGEYIGRARLAHVNDYRLRVDDQISFLYRNMREEIQSDYRISVGDVLEIRCLADAKMDTTVEVLPDGTISPILIQSMKATKLTLRQLRDKLETEYKKYYNIPGISIREIKVNTKLVELLAVVDNRQGVTGGQGVVQRVNPEGGVALPAIGTVMVQGLTLEELKREVNLRYQETIPGVEITPVLNQRAPRYVYILGEVRSPGRYELVQPTTVMNAISMAGGFNFGGKMQQIVIFRRGDDWRLMATVVNLEDAMLRGNNPNPQGEIWVSDADQIVVPQSPLLITDNYINLLFTRGLYGVLPINGSYNFGASTIR